LTSPKLGTVLFEILKGQQRLVWKLQIKNIVNQIRSQSETLTSYKFETDAEAEIIINFFFPGQINFDGCLLT
jgi:hypothetical protein